MRTFNSPFLSMDGIFEFSFHRASRTYIFVEEMQGIGILSISAKIEPCELRFMLVTVQRKSLTEVISFVRLS
jgi:hypothetical protein